MSSCICAHEDPIDCMAIRYGEDPIREHRRADPQECECSCHDSFFRVCPSCDSPSIDDEGCNSCGDHRINWVL